MFSVYLSFFWVFLRGGCGLSALVRTRLPLAAGLKVAPKVALFPLLQKGKRVCVLAASIPAAWPLAS